MRQQNPGIDEIDAIRRNLTRIELELMEGALTDPQKVAIYCQQVQTDLQSLEGKVFNDLGLYAGETSSFQPLHSD